MEMTSASINKIVGFNVPKLHSVRMMGAVVEDSELILATLVSWTRAQSTVNECFCIWSPLEGGCCGWESNLQPLASPKPLSAMAGSRVEQHQRYVKEKKCHLLERTRSYKGNSIWASQKEHLAVEQKFVLV